MYHPASHLVYVAEASDVRHVMIDGNWIVKDRQLLTLDIESVLDTAFRFKRAVQFT
jgi:cytosine/adenosine deaminase-related metal-dependent hydrolase